MSWTVTINYGSGDVELTDYSGENLVYDESFKKTQELYNRTTFKPVTSQAWFSFYPNTTLMTALFGLDRDQEISVNIQEDSTDWFTGYIRPITEYTDTNQKKRVDVECVDEGWALKAEPSGYIYKRAADSMTVCDTTTTAQSLVHWLLTEAGYTGTVNAYDISDSIPYFLSHNVEYFDLLTDLLFSYHATFYFDASGDFHLYNWGAETGDVSSTATLDEDDMLGQLSINRDTDEPDTPAVTYYRQASQSGIELHKRSEAFGLTGNCTLLSTLFGGGCSPYTAGSATWDSGGVVDLPVWAQYDKDIVIDIPDSVDGVTNFWCKAVGNLRFYDYRNASWTTGPQSTEKDTEIGDMFTMSSASTEYLFPYKPDNYVICTERLVHTVTDSDTLEVTQSAQHNNITGGPGIYSIGMAMVSSLTIHGEGYVAEEDGVALGPDIGTGEKDFDARYCYDSDNAAELATALSYNIENGEFKYEWRSQQDLTLGAYYTINNTQANRSVLARIVKKTHTIHPGDIDFYEYEARQYVGFGSVFTSVTEGLASSPVSIIEPAGTLIVGNSISSDYEAVEDGLFLTSDHLGFYDSEDEEWTAYIANDGTFKFQGDASNYIEWDGATFEIHGDLYCSGDSELQGTITTGNGIYSDNYNAGVAGWGIDGDGDAEFNTITIRQEAFEANITAYESALTVGQRGTYGSEAEGDSRTLIDDDQISFEEYTDGDWSDANRVTLAGSDSSGNFYPFLSCRGVVNPLADEIDGEAIPSHLFRVFNFENDYNDQFGVDPWTTKTNLSFSSSIKKFGSYALSTSSSYGTCSFSESWGDDTPVACGAWVYIGSGPFTGGTAFPILHMANGSYVEAGVNDDDFYYKIHYSGVDYTDTVAEIADITGWHYLAISFDPDNAECHFVFDNNLYTESLSGAWGTASTMVTTLTPASGSPSYGLTAIIDEFTYVLGEYAHPDIFIQHHNHGVTWNTEISCKDVILIPANNGRTRTDYPAGYIYGLETSAATDSDHDVTVGAGKCRSYSDLYNLDLRGDMTKQIDATWAAGTNAGGLFSGTVAADTTYHLFLIRKDSDSSIDAGFDTDIDCANIPSGYTAYRRIWSVRTDASANIKPYKQMTNWCRYLDRSNNAAYSWATMVAGVDNTITANDVPVHSSFGRFLVNIYDNSDEPDITWFLPGETTYTPTYSANGSSSDRANAGQYSGSPADPGGLQLTCDIEVSESVFIARVRQNSSVSIHVFGYQDDRGQYGGK